jgi:hypothetical protein
MNFIVIGCGRVGAELSHRLFQNGYQVAVVDTNQQAFNRLHPDFRGRTVVGDSLSADTLTRAGADKARGAAVVTSSDTMNAVIGHTIRTYYPNVKQVIVRNYDPAMREMLEAFGLQIVSSTSWGAERVQELLIDPSFRVRDVHFSQVEWHEHFQIAGGMQGYGLCRTHPCRAGGTAHPGYHPQKRRCPYRQRHVRRRESPARKTARRRGGVTCSYSLPAAGAQAPNSHPN